MVRPIEIDSRICQHQAGLIRKYGQSKHFASSVRSPLRYADIPLEVERK